MTKELDIFPAVPMKSTNTRTMWMAPRCIRRVEAWKLVQIIKLLDSVQANVETQDQQDKLYERLELLGVKRNRVSGGVANAGGFRTYLALLLCLGLYVHTDAGWELTNAGLAMRDAQRPIDILRTQLLRMQFPSVYGNGHNVKIDPTVSVKPCCFLLKLMQDPDVGAISNEEAAIPVIYGQTDDDYGRCVAKILHMRSSNCGIEEVIDTPEDLCTSRRKYDTKNLIQLGVEDAKNIGNTYLNYLLAARLVCITKGKGNRKLYQVTAEPEALAIIAEKSVEPIRPIIKGHETAWQRHFGRWNKQKGISTSKDSSAPKNGFVSLIQTSYISEISERPYGFDHDNFIQRQAEMWHVPIQDIQQACLPLLDRVTDIERDTVLNAAYSGGKDATLLEKALTNIFIRLGFDSSKWTGCKKPSNGRQGGYPDIYLRCSSSKACGWADAKATSRYKFDLGDTLKLSSYYHDCDKEMDPSTTASFFIYIAGGFDKKTEQILQNLENCTNRYGRPVSAVTVQALLDLIDRKIEITPEALSKAFEVGGYFNSASQLVSFTS